MCHQAGNEGQNGCVGWEGAAPVFARRMLLCDEIIRVVKRHEYNNQPSQRIKRKESLALWFIHGMCSRAGNLREPVKILRQLPSL